MATANGTVPADDYTPKNILITGGCGFIASHVAIRLVKNYPQYKVIVTLPRVHSRKLYPTHAQMCCGDCS